MDIHWIEWTALTFGVLYIYRAYRNQWDAWLFGIVSCFLWAYASYTFYQLYADSALQLFYVAMGFWGLYNWSPEKDEKLKISAMTWKQHALTILLGIILAIPYAFYLKDYTNASLPWADAFTTVFAIGATYWLIRRKKENWLYWIVLNSAYIFIYYLKSAEIFLGITLIYLLMALLAWRKWQKVYDLSVN
ncbi:MAG TPA: nicotinamide riboside transporter PnuC [Saprospiraceae bacterium]|nr:nicotinamide riboside transporter PnuC [Saprospiraceae bacterium]